MKNLLKFNKKFYFFLFLAIILSLFPFSDYFVLFAKSNETDDLIIDIKIKEKSYFIGDVIHLYLYTKEQPTKIYSNDENIFIKNYNTSKKKKFYLSIIDIQCFTLGTINLNNIKILFGSNICDLGNANIKIVSFMDKYNLSFKFPDKLKIGNVAFLNLIFILSGLFIIIILIIIIIKHSKEIVFLLSNKNKHLNDVIKYINNLKKINNVKLKEKYYYLSEVLKNYPLKLDYTSQILFDKVKYELKNDELVSNYDFYNSKFNEIADDIIIKLKELEKVKK